MTLSKVLVVALATGLVAVGIAAQTGTVHLPRNDAPRPAAAKHPAAAVRPLAKPSHAARSTPASPSPTPTAATDGDGD